MHYNLNILFIYLFIQIVYITTIQWTITIYNDLINCLIKDSKNVHQMLWCTTPNQKKLGQYGKRK